jgi:hypothetical protein
MVRSLDLVSSGELEGKSCFENGVLSEDVNTDVRRIEGPREGCIHGHVLLNDWSNSGTKWEFKSW